MTYLGSLLMLTFGFIYTVFTKSERIKDFFEGFSINLEKDLGITKEMRKKYNL